MRDWLMEKRIQSGNKQINVAKKSGITQQFYNMIETGKRRPSPEVAQRIAAVLGFDWTLFFEPPADTDKSA